MRLPAAAKTEDLVENHKLLNDLCHKLDATRPTTMAHIFMLDANDPLAFLPDIRSYNLYYGWYVGGGTRMMRGLMSSTRTTPMP